MPARVRLVTLTSDVGTAYAAQIKGVLARTLPPGRVIDLTHDLNAHQIEEAAFLLRQMASGFPAGTVHVAVVDPGVGGERRPIAVLCGEGSVLVGPDNGLLSPLAERFGDPKAYEILPSGLRAPPAVGTTFDGRDVFAPAAALLARGRSPARLGPPVPMRRLVLPSPARTPGGWKGTVLHSDRFGNLISNIDTDSVPSGVRQVQLTLGAGPTRTVPVVRSYESLPAEGLGVIGSSFGTLEVSVREGSAADRLHVGVGAALRVIWRQGKGTSRSQDGK